VWHLLFLWFAIFYFAWRGACNSAMSEAIQLKAPERRQSGQVVLYTTLARCWLLVGGGAWAP